MQRDMELIRKILFAVEEKYIDTWLRSDEIAIDDYDMKIIGYHCAILHDAGIVSDYKGHYADNELQFFGVGHLTWDGHELLDKINSDIVWNKTKDIITKKGLPMVIDVVKDVASAIIIEMTKAAIQG